MIFRLSKIKKSKVITMGVAAIILILTLAVIILNLGENSAAVAEIPEETPETLQDESAQIIQIETPEQTQNSTEKTPEVTTTISTETEPPIEEMSVETTSALPVTTTIPTTEKTEVTLAPVEIPDENVAEILEENNIAIITTTPVQQTMPPPENKPHETTYVDGQKYTWNPVLGWVKTSGDGNTIIMDVESNGEKYEGGW